ncbi:DUF262 domain-containing protein [Phanerochaete sordida]|uniref:DUF262 domain-containing protein n=1 Tax=Phanerochaete sordida TaxID=48140 RepID=A0A9P3GJ32_9APHY|nr:DUF262 domain-containing protein [Phanerochaete sordida]
MANPIDSEYVKEEAEEVDQLLSDIPDIPDCLPELGAEAFEACTPLKLYSRVSRGKIDLNPPYQRDPVWPEAKQMKLIDSVFRNYPIPNILFAEETREGTTVKRCIDGKQRLTSVLNFMNGRIPFKHPLTKQSLWYTAPPSPSGESSSSKKCILLPPRLKAKFDKAQLLCITYRGITEGQEREMFQRIQLGMPLGTAEKLQAIQSPRSDWVCSLIPKYLSRDRTSLVSKIQLDCTRAKDFLGVAQLAYCCENLPDVRLSLGSGLEAWLKQQDAPRKDFARGIASVLSTMTTLACTPALNAAFTEVKERVSPVEFIFIGVLIYVAPHAPHAALAAQLLEMRREVRAAHTDVRTNNKVVRSLWEFVARAADELNAETRIVVPPPKESKARQPRGKKRKVSPPADQVKADEEADAEVDDDGAEDEDEEEVDELVDEDVGPRAKRRRTSIKLEE